VEFLNQNGTDFLRESQQFRKPKPATGVAGPWPKLKAVLMGVLGLAILVGILLAAFVVGSIIASLLLALLAVVLIVWVIRYIFRQSQTRL
jgi:Flp pilus assembly protein TadB